MEAIMKASRKYVLTLNGGSSSIKLAAFEVGEKPTRGLVGTIERIGGSGTCFTYHDAATEQPATVEDLPAGLDFAGVVDFLVTWLEDQAIFADIAVVGHRVVHGLDHTAPERVTQQLIDGLQRITAYDLDHLPGEIALIEAFRRRHPQLPQFACFDTAFHRTMPRVAQLLPLPRRFDAKGVRRYGFHGLSYAYLLEALAQTAGPAAAQGRVILAHLGSGASLAAVREGRSLDTTMGFTPTAGLPMGTRTGDLDPGVAGYLLLTEKLTPEAFNHMVSHQSGLLGVSETSSDVRDLLKRQATDPRAAEAVDLFCYQTRKAIGAFAAVLGGLETLVFSGGIGEHAAEVRARVCQGLEFLGVEIDPAQNVLHAPLISTAASRVAVRVIPTDEELMIAQTICRLWAPMIDSIS
jgi:acetate kinase